MSNNDIHIDDVIAKRDPTIIDGYSGAYCKCNYCLFIPTPEYKAFYTIKCPKCGFELQLFCGKNK